MCLFLNTFTITGYKFLMYSNVQFHFILWIQNYYSNYPVLLILSKSTYYNVLENIHVQRSVLHAVQYVWYAVIKSFSPQITSTYNIFTLQYYGKGLALYSLNVSEKEDF